MIIRVAERSGRKLSYKDHRGVLIGLACGDALGATLEFMSATQIRAVYGQLRDMIGGGWLDLSPGSITDDTQMALALARALVSNNPTVEQVAENFVRWASGTGPDSNERPRDIGNQTRASIDLLAQGVVWRAAGLRVWRNSEGKAAGNGGVMRCAPVALRFHNNPKLLDRWSRDTCSVTHADPRCEDSCVFINRLIACLLHGETPDYSVLYDDLHSDIVSYVQMGMNENWADLAKRTGGYTAIPVSWAVWALEHTDNLEEGIIQVANAGGDADTNAAVAGAVLGARYGADAVPQRWLDTVQFAPLYTSLADSLFLER